MFDIYMNTQDRDFPGHSYAVLGEAQKLSNYPVNRHVISIDLGGTRNRSIGNFPDSIIREQIFRSVTVFPAMQATYLRGRLAAESQQAIASSENSISTNDKAFNWRSQRGAGSVEGQGY